MARRWGQRSGEPGAAHTDSVWFAENLEHQRVASSTPGTRFAPIEALLFVVGFCITDGRKP